MTEIKLTNWPQVVEGANLKDMYCNMIILGEQSDSTWNPTEQMVRSFCQKEHLGVAVFDTDFVLRSTNQFDRIVDPMHVQLNVIESLEPLVVAKTIRATATEYKKGQAGKMFEDEAESFIRRGLYVIRTLSDSGIAIHYSLTALKNFLSDEPMRLALLRQFFAGGIGDLVPNEGYKIHISAGDQLDKMPEYLRDAFKYFLVVYPTTAAETRSGVVFTANAWLDQMVGNAVMNAWAGHESDFNVIEELVHGAKIGIAAPEELCGPGGAVGVALLKHAIYERIFLRGQNPSWRDHGETPVLVCLGSDAISAVNVSDEEALKWLREFEGGALLTARGIEQIQDRLGEHTENFLRLFDSFVLGKSSEKTEHYFSNNVWNRYQHPPLEAFKPILAIPSAAISVLRQQGHARATVICDEQQQLAQTLTKLLPQM